MQSVLKSIWKSIDVIMAVILTCMVALVFTNVVLRYGFSSGLRPSVELSRLGLVWVVMLGAAVVLRRGEHLAVAEFSERLFPKAVPVLRRICWVIVLISVGMLYVGSYRQMMSNWSDISQLTRLPSALFYLAGVVSGLLMGVIAFMRIFKPDWQLDSLDEEKE
ncbi:TRAP-type transport system small permease protein [Vibrio crassostreae]|nr:TRAP-type transport system small permease protein [Vibrio crassostreae]CAK3304758.1 TRAP-type transport system small permease protein [Vibrio crassostreae]CAK3317838.1 TRAP-type transport system small permease protein [Vibrio crassostreae]CAK3341272.1 TRAP-type transport system small permease protein [Vibrio crassostreae]CAK3372139.1 TRAP-type transport system small permease protein [Vibrio crassostreae]